MKKKEKEKKKAKKKEKKTHGKRQKGRLITQQLLVGRKLPLYPQTKRTIESLRHDYK